jgi:hypothetical protein
LGASGSNFSFKKDNKDIQDVARFQVDLIKELFLPIQRENGSRIFGEKLEDY